MFQSRKPCNRKEIYTLLKAQKNFLDWNHEVFHKRVWMMTEWTIEIRYLTLDALRCQTIQLIQNSNTQVHSIKRKKSNRAMTKFSFLSIKYLITHFNDSKFNVKIKSMCNWQFKHKFKFYLYQCYTKLRLLVSVNLSCSRY